MYKYSLFILFLWVIPKAMAQSDRGNATDEYIGFYQNNNCIAIAPMNEKINKKILFSYGAQMGIAINDWIYDYNMKKETLDKCIDLLLEKLEEKGILQDTVIVVAGDHYPYGLNKNEILELSGNMNDYHFERFHAPLIIYNSDVQGEVDKYAFSIYSESLKKSVIISISLILSIVKKLSFILSITFFIVSPPKSIVYYNTTLIFMQ